MALQLFTAASDRKTVLGYVALAIGLLILPYVGMQFGNSPMRTVDMALLYVMLALGLNIVVGFAGLLDLGYVAFYALGAYMVGLLASPQFATLLQSVVNEYPVLGAALVSIMGKEILETGIHLSVWVIVPLAAALAGLAGAILGAPTLKLRGDYLAIVTLGFGEIIRILMNNLDGPKINFTNGAQGINNIDPIRIFGASLSGEPGSKANLIFGHYSMPSVNAYYFLFLFLCIAVIFLTSRLQHSRLGRAWVAIREDEIAAKAMGINTRNVKLLAFSMGASFGGIAGAMYASFIGSITPEAFSFNESILILAMVVLGGIGHIRGVVVGAVLLAALPEILRFAVEPAQQAIFGHVVIETAILRQLLYGLALVLTMLFRPAGLWPSPQHEDRPDAAETNKTDAFPA
jgi:branched-chain amino acid transport system permease protein